MGTNAYIKRIYRLLPRLNCGLCGFGNCAQFARAVAEGRASPFGCGQVPWVGYRISEIMGVKSPAIRYGFKREPFARVSAESLKGEVDELLVQIDEILAKIEDLRSANRKL